LVHKGARRQATAPLGHAGRKGRALRTRVRRRGSDDGKPDATRVPTEKACLAICVKNCDATYKQALSAGARALQEPTDQFYGDRNARFEDPFGNEWSVMTHVKNVSEREMKKAMAQMASGGCLFSSLIRPQPSELLAGGLSSSSLSSRTGDAKRCGE